jgi:putative oxidoreductase
MLLGAFPSTSLLIVRLGLGVIFFAHGVQKVFGWFGDPGLRGTIAYFKQALGVPAPLTVIAALTECFGGPALIVGFLVRPAAVGLIMVMRWPSPRSTGRTASSSIGRRSQASDTGSR